MSTNRFAQVGMNVVSSSYPQEEQRQPSEKKRKVKKISTTIQNIPDDLLSPIGETNNPLDEASPTITFKPVQKSGAVTSRNGQAPKIFNFKSTTTSQPTNPYFQQPQQMQVQAIHPQPIQSQPYFPNWNPLSQSMPPNMLYQQNYPQGNMYAFPQMNAPTNNYNYSGGTPKNSGGMGYFVPNRFYPFQNPQNMMSPANGQPMTSQSYDFLPSIKRGYTGDPLVDTLQKQSEMIQEIAKEIHQPRMSPEMMETKLLKEKIRQLEMKNLERKLEDEYKERVSAETVEYRPSPKKGLFEVARGSFRSQVESDGSDFDTPTRNKFRITSRKLNPARSMGDLDAGLHSGSLSTRYDSENVSTSGRKRFEYGHETPRGQHSRFYAYRGGDSTDRSIDRELDLSRNTARYNYPREDIDGYDDYDRGYYNRDYYYDDPERDMPVRRAKRRSSKKAVSAVFDNDVRFRTERAPMDEGRKPRKPSTQRIESLNEMPFDDEEDDGEGKPARRKLTSRKNTRTKTIKKTITVVSQEEINKMKQEKKAKARKALKNILWAAAYPKLILAFTRRKVIRRKTTVYKTIIDGFGYFNNNAQDFFAENLFKQIKAFYLERKSMVLTSGEEKGLFGSKKISSDEIEDKVKNLIMPKMRALLNQLIHCTMEGTFPVQLAEFIANISENGCAPPNHFLFEFEIRRLQYTHYGTLKNLTDNHSKMIIGMFLLMRVLIYQFFVKPWTEIRKGSKLDPPGKEDQTKLNLKTIASILYHCLMDLYKSKLPVIPGNQNFLPPELKIKPRTDILHTERGKDEEAKKKSAEEDVIEGLYTKKQLEGFFVTKATDANQVKASLNEVLNNIYASTHKVYLAKKAIPREEVKSP